MISSDDHRVQSIKQGLDQMLTATLDHLKLEGELRDMVSSLAITAFVWECGQRNPRIPAVVTKSLVTIAVDQGLAEEIGMIEVRSKTETLQ